MIKGNDDVMIETEKIILREGEILNNLLICLICQSILNDPRECKDCQRAYCHGCVKKLVLPQKCPSCSEIQKKFVKAHIQTRHSLNTLIFKMTDCDCIVNYKDYSKHLIRCNKNDPEVVTPTGSDEKQSILPEKDAILVVSPDLTKEEEIPNPELNVENSHHSGCYICEKESSGIKLYKCLSCENDFCLECEEKDRYEIDSYIFNVKQVLKFHIFLYCRDEYRRNQICFKNFVLILMYILCGLICDIFVFTMIVMVFILLQGIMQFLIYVPVYFIYWTFFNCMRRKCVNCTKK
jgi:hypothetical protein